MRLTVGKSLVALTLLVLATSSAARRVPLASSLPSADTIVKISEDADPAAVRQQATTLAETLLQGENSRKEVFKLAGDALLVGDCQAGPVLKMTVGPTAVAVYNTFVGQVKDQIECLAALDADQIVRTTLLNASYVPYADISAPDSAPETLPTVEEIIAISPDGNFTTLKAPADSIALNFIFGGSAGIDAVKAVSTALTDSECLEGPVGKYFLPAVNKAITSYVVQSAYDFSQCKAEGRLSLGRLRGTKLPRDFFGEGVEGVFSGLVEGLYFNPCESDEYWCNEGDEYW